MNVNQFPDRIIEIDQEHYLYFGGTAYLGLPTNKDFQELAIKNIQQWGTTYGSSRSANIKLTAYENGENFLAQYIKAERAVTVSSGMLAGKLVIDQLKKQTDSFFHFPNTHNAIQTNESLPVFINNEINPRLLDSQSEKITVLTDGVSGFQTTAIDLSILKEIPNHKQITLLVDESHSFGILGKDGCGIYSEIDIPVKRKIMISSLGKAFGLNGGVIASDVSFINQIKEQDIFISAAGMNPAFVQTLADASEIYKVQHHKLIENLSYIDQNIIKKDTIKFNKSYPLIYLEDENLIEILRENKIIIASFKYQSNSKNLNRIVITANHLQEDLEKLISVINGYNFK
jgi:8-amino-7-oxononanoate synthase